MRSMGHPDYVYRPWTEERRAAASLAHKKRIQLQRQGQYQPKQKPGIWRDPSKYQAWVEALVPKEAFGRSDLVQDILISLLEGRYIISELRGNTPAMRKFKKEFFGSSFERAGYALSIDAPLPGTNNLRIADVLSYQEKHDDDDSL